MATEQKKERKHTNHTKVARDWMHDLVRISLVLGSGNKNLPRFSSQFTYPFYSRSNSEPNDVLPNTRPTSLHIWNQESMKFTLMLPFYSFQVLHKRQSPTSFQDKLILTRIKRRLTKEQHNPNEE